MDYREQANLMQRDAEEFDGPGYIIGDLRQGAKSITDLLARAEVAEARAEKAERERDAAVKDLHIAEDCDTCKTTTCVPRGGNGKCRFEWRGQKEE